MLSLVHQTQGAPLPSYLSLKTVSPVQVDWPFCRFLNALCLLLSQGFFLKYSFPAAHLLNSFVSLRSQLRVVLREAVPTPSLCLSPSKRLPLAHKTLVPPFKAPVSDFS